MSRCLKIRDIFTGKKIYHDVKERMVCAVGQVPFSSSQYFARYWAVFSRCFVRRNTNFMKRQLMKTWVRDIANFTIFPPISGKNDISYGTHASSRTHLLKSFCFEIDHIGQTPRHSKVVRVKRQPNSCEIVFSSGEDNHIF